jgi:cellulose synthase/poly-beta-1,6-N-acetylglucosamine synthase-like glycosyltransferase
MGRHPSTTYQEHDAPGRFDRHPRLERVGATRSCLETLRPTVGLRDQVIVVDNGSQDGTATGLRRYPWVRVVTHERNLGFAAGCNRGAAVASGEVLVFLNNDTLLTPRWLDGLLSPFGDATIGATGPRSNFVSGPQLVPDVPYSGGRVGDLQRFAREWRHEHRSQTTDVTASSASASPCDAGCSRTWPASTRRSASAAARTTTCACGS